MRYRSWKQGRGHEVLLCRDTTGRYGLRQYALGDNQFSYSPVLADASRPATIDAHGTEVTLMGAGEEANTAMPAGTTSPTWISKYLNSRYYRFPQVRTVRVDEASLVGAQSIQPEDTHSPARKPISTRTPRNQAS